MQTWLTQEQHFALIGLRNEIEKRARDLRSAEYPRYVGHAEDLRRAELRATALDLLLKEIVKGKEPWRPGYE